MSDNKNITKKSNKVILFIFCLAIALIMCYFLIPVGVNFVRERKIVKTMKNVYSESQFVSVDCDKEPIDRSQLEEQYIWFGDGLPEEDLYVFLITDSKDRVATGFATKDGDVIFDTYAYQYYMEDMKEYFVSTVDFEGDFPDLEYYIPDIVPTNERRVVYTHDCITFEGFKKSSTIGYFSLGTGGYPGLDVILSDTSEQTINRIEEILVDADFDIYVEFNSASGDFSDSDSLYNFDNAGSYYPFGESYDKAILGQ